MQQPTEKPLKVMMWMKKEPKIVYLITAHTTNCMDIYIYSTLYYTLHVF